jgi:hypothetical protein
MGNVTNPIQNGSIESMHASTDGTRDIRPDYAGQGHIDRRAGSAAR